MARLDFLVDVISVPGELSVRGGGRASRVVEAALLSEFDRGINSDMRRSSFFLGDARDDESTPIAAVWSPPRVCINCKKLLLLKIFSGECPHVGNTKNAYLH